MNVHALTAVSSYLKSSLLNSRLEYGKTDRGAMEKMQKINETMFHPFGVY
jgi:hypothetical protein